MAIAGELDSVAAARGAPETGDERPSLVLLAKPKPFHKSCF
jgi:hypothetical protein